MCKHIWKLWTRFINQSRLKRLSVRALVCRALHNCTNYIISLTSSILHNTTATTMEQCHESRHSYGVKTHRVPSHICRFVTPTWQHFEGSMQVDVIIRYLRVVATRAAAISRAIVCEVKVLCGCGCLVLGSRNDVTWRWSGGREAGRGAGRQPRLFSPASSRHRGLMPALMAWKVCKGRK